MRRKSAKAHRQQVKASRILALALLAFLLYAIFHGFNIRAYADAPLLSPEGDTPEFFLEFVHEVTPTPTATPSPAIKKGKPATEAEKEAVVEYMRQKFGDAFEMAYAVARVEGWPNAEGQGWDRNLCWHRVENGRNKGENSWGIFQINIVEGCNGEGDEIHWNRIPGETLQEKAEWLSNPFNNIALAHKIYSEQGWNPWTGFTSGNYKKYIGNGGDTQ